MKRFGRNQRKELREEVSALQRQVSELEGPWCRAREGMTELSDIFQVARETVEVEQSVFGTKKTITLKVYFSHADSRKVLDLNYSGELVAWRGFAYILSQLSIDGVGHPEAGNVAEVVLKAMCRPKSKPKGF